MRPQLAENRANSDFFPMSLTVLTRSYWNARCARKLLSELRERDMPVLEDAKRTLEKLTGFKRPKRKELDGLLRSRKPQAFRFANDGTTPNNRVPLIVYRTPVSLPDRLDPAAVFEELFEAHGWSDSWRNGMYAELHFHTRTHEVLGIARGRLRAEFGGSRGKIIALKAGDVVVLPAGTGHRRLSASKDLLVVGAYPRTGSYDEPRAGEVDADEATRAICRVALPSQDPVYGKTGPLLRLWRALKRGRPNGDGRDHARRKRTIKKRKKN
jgi:uncharacterized protein YjlB